MTWTANMPFECALALGLVGAISGIKLGGATIQDFVAPFISVQTIQQEAMAQQSRDRLATSGTLGGIGNLAGLGLATGLAVGARRLHRTLA
jgi:hypothetical protein